MIFKTLKHLASGAQGLTIGDQALVSGINFLVNLMLARMLGMEAYGVFAFAWMLVFFTSSLHQAFMIKSLFTLLPKQADPSTYLKGSMALQLCCTIVTVVVLLAVLLIVSVLYPEAVSPELLVLLPLCCASFIHNDYLRRYFFAKRQPGYALLMDLVGYGMQPILLFLLYKNALLGLGSALGTICALQALSALLSSVLFYSEGLSWIALPYAFKTNWKYSKYLVGTALLQWVCGNLFIAVAATTLGSVAVGGLRIGQSLTGVLHVLLLAMENLIPLRASELFHAQGKQRMLHFMRNTALRFLLPTLLLLGVIFLWRRPIVEVLFGIEYVQFHNIIAAFCGLYLLIFFGTLLRFVIRVYERNGVIFLGYVLSSLFSLSFASMMVHQWGLTGVIAGLFAVQLITLGSYLVAIKSDLKWIFK